MRQEYNKLFDKITSERSDNELLQGALRKAENMQQKKRLNKRAVIIPIAAAMTVIIGGIGASAAFGFDYLINLFAGNEALVSEIQESVFEDSDGHVSVTIEQFAADDRYAHALVHYSAIDEQGEIWLSGKRFVGENCIYESDCIKLVYTKDDKAEYEGSSISELEQQRTETDRYFYLVRRLGHHSEWFNDEYKLYFSYVLSDNIARTPQLEEFNTTESIRYRIVGDERCSKFITPTYLDISPLSFALYADDDYGLIKRENFASGGYAEYINVPFEEFSEEVSDIKTCIVMEDGTKLQLLGISSGPLYKDEWAVGFADWLLGTGEIFNIDGLRFQFSRDYDISFDFDKIVGIEIGGVYYELIAE